MKPSTLSLSIFALFSGYSFADVIEPTSSLETIVVQADQENETLTSTTSITKFNQHVLDTPFSRSMVDQKQIQQQDIQTVDDAIYHTSGVFHQTDYGGGFWDNYSFRGFGTDPDMGATTIRNGLSVNRGINAPKDMVNVESLEFLKGSAAAIYGRGEVGGLLNVTTKKPKWQQENIVQLRANTDEKYRLSVEHTAPINDQIAYRIAMSGEDNQSFRDYVYSKQLFISPQLTWKLSDQTQLDFDSEWSERRALFDRGVSSVRQQLVMDPKTYTGEPDSDENKLNNQFYQLRLAHQINEDWKVNSAISYKQTHLTGTSTEPRRMLNDVTLTRFRRHRDNESKDILAQADILGQIQSPWAKHDVLLSSELGQLDYRQRLLRKNPNFNTLQYLNEIDIRRGWQIYNNQLYQLTAADQSEDFNEKQRYFALNLQDQMFFNDQWSALLGVRYDYVQQQFDNYNLTQYATSQQKQQHHQWSPRVGINYKATDVWSWYANYGQSFAMNSRLDINGKPFDPEYGTNYELGTKYQFADRGLLGIALFHSKKRNILTDAGTGYYTTVGEAVSQGVEMDATYHVNDQISLGTHYTYINAQVKEDPNLERTGKRLSNIPKHSGTLSGHYEFLQQGEQKAGIGGSINYIGKRSGHYVDNGFTLPAYTLVNVYSYYAPSERIRYQLNIHNLLNETYYPASYSQLWIQAGEPLNASFSMQFKF